MSMFDKAKEFVSENVDKVKDLAAEHSDKVEEISDQGIEKAGDFAESKGVDADKVAQGEEFIDGKIGNEGTQP